MSNEIKIISFEFPEEYILSHEALSHYETPNTVRALANIDGFARDFKRKNLEKYSGTFVCYWKGILCGQSKYADKLFDTARNYYGHSHLSLFRVPVKPETLEDVLADSRNEFGIAHTLGDLATARICLSMESFNF